MSFHIRFDTPVELGMVSTGFALQGQALQSLGLGITRATAPARRVHHT